MATNAQIRANRQNTKRSTGPRTRQGKARASRNAVTHGLLARQAVLRDEDPQRFEDLRHAMRADLDPDGAMEEELVEQIVLYAWRLRRATRIETDVLANEMTEDETVRARDVCSRFQENTKNFTDSEGVTSSEIREVALLLIQQMQLRASSYGPRLAFAKVANRHDLLTTLSRYEVTLQRNMHRAHERCESSRLDARVARWRPRGPSS